MFDSLEIQSHIGMYRVHFVEDGPARANALGDQPVHFIVDRRIAALYGERLTGVLAAPSVLLIDASEQAKSLEQMPRYVEHLAAKRFRRNSRLVAIGGGVTQDITCFLAATMMRGVDWLFFPTTLLAQADSCIGSKSSINSGQAKNILGTFTPPREVYIDVGFLDSLEERDVRSGVGEILKVHAIDGEASFSLIASDYERLFCDKLVMIDYVRRALAIKQPYIEADEYDHGVRQVFNYGHSFGHAIESATEFAIPHGLAVTMGMDVANFVASRLGHSGYETFGRMHPVLRRNYRGYEDLPVPMDRFFAALSHDKKNTDSSTVTVILPDQQGHIAKTALAADAAFRTACSEYMVGARSS